MGRYELSIDVRLPPDEVFRLWTDAGRWPQWQFGLLGVTEASGPATEVGTVLHLDFGPGIKRYTRVVDVDPPRTYTVEEDGMRSRNRTAVAFEPIGSGTRIVLTYDLHVQLGVVSGVMERLTRGEHNEDGTSGARTIRPIRRTPTVRTDPRHVLHGRRVRRISGRQSDRTR